MHADLSAWAPEPRSYALVLGIGFWDAAVFRAAAAAVADGGLLAWEALTAEALRTSIPASRGNSASVQASPPRFCPDGFTVMRTRRDGVPGQLATRRSSR